MLTTAAHTPHRVRRHRVMVQEVITIRCPQCVATGISITAQDPSRTLPSSIESQNLKVLGALRHSHLKVTMIISAKQERAGGRTLGAESSLVWSCSSLDSSQMQSIFLRDRLQSLLIFEMFVVQVQLDAGRPAKR